MQNGPSLKIESPTGCPANSRTCEVIRESFFRRNGHKTENKGRLSPIMPLCPIGEDGASLPQMGAIGQGLEALVQAGRKAVCGRLFPEHEGGGTGVGE
jgi:hypothetical protein